MCSSYSFFVIIDVWRRSNKIGKKTYKNCMADKWAVIVYTPLPYHHPLPREWKKRPAFSLAIEPFTCVNFFFLGRAHRLLVYISILLQLEPSLSSGVLFEKEFVALYELMEEQVRGR